MQRRLERVDQCIDFMHRNTIGNQALTRTWNAVKDMLTVAECSSGLSPEDASTARRAAFRVLCACAATQSDRLGMLRYVFVSTIRKHLNKEDEIWRLQAIHCLTDGGKDLGVFAEEVAKLVLHWLQTEDPNLQHEAFVFLVAIIRHSYSAMDPQSTKFLTIKMCELCLEAVRQHNVKAAKQMLTFFDAMVQHGSLPSGSQKQFISTLCCLVNLESHAAWKIMKKLLSGNCGHQGIYELLLLLDSPKANTANVLRGAVFFVGMSSWGSQVS